MIPNKSVLQRQEPDMTQIFNKKLIQKVPAVMEPKYRGRPVLTFAIPVDGQGQPVQGYQQNLVDIPFDAVYGRAKEYGK